MYRQYLHHQAKPALFNSLVAYASTEHMPNNAARQSIAGILESPVMTEAWDNTYPSRQNENPAASVAMMIRNLEDNPRYYLELLTFMRRLAAIEQRALGKPNKNETKDEQDFRSYIHNLSSYLDALPGEMLDDEDLPQDFRKVLTIAESVTGQIPIRPLHTTWKIIKEYGKELQEHVHEHKIAVSALGLASLGIVGFTFATTGGAQTNYTNPELLNTTNLSMDNFFDPNAPLASDPNMAHEMMLKICHDNFPLGHLISKSELLLPHCSRVKTLSADAKGMFNTLYSRMDTAMLNPLQDFIGTVLPVSEFRASFEAATNNAANFWYKFDAWENLTLHGLITAAAAYLTYKYRTTNKEELKESWNNTCDFFRSTAHYKPLNYILCASGSALSYMAYNGFHPSFVWYGLLGGVTGQVIHNAINRSNAPSFAEQSTLSIRKELASLADQENIVSADISNTTPPNHKPTSWDKVRKPFKVALATTAATGAVADVVLNQGHAIATTCASAVVTSIYWFINVPQDTVIHWIAAITGATLGESAYRIKSGKDKTVSFMKRMLESSIGNQEHEPR